MTRLLLCGVLLAACKGGEHQLASQVRGYCSMSQLEAERVATHTAQLTREQRQSISLDLDRAYMFCATVRATGQDVLDRHMKEIGRPLQTFAESDDLAAIATAAKQVAAGFAEVSQLPIEE